MNIADKAAIRQCTSCQLCATVCVHKAIAIALDDRGFYRPVVDESLCNDCGNCIRVCYKFDNQIETTSDDGLCKKTLYSAWSEDNRLLSETTSGGIGDLLAHELLKEGYRVVGVVYNNDADRAEHSIAKSEEELIGFRGSKYIQSYTFEAFLEVVKRCRNEKFAVFGTPCQIYALNKLANQKKVRENFLFVDLYCHGCPSIHIWTKYSNHIKEKTGFGKFDQVIFRSKLKGWGTFYVVVVVDGKVIFKSKPGDNGFYDLFFSDQVLNEGCHDCLLRGSLEYTDIRLGDFWGKKYLDNSRGVSAVSIATDKGAELFEKIKSHIVWEECKYEDFLKYQSWGKVYKPNDSLRNHLFDCLSNPMEDIKDIVKYYHIHQSKKEKIKRYIKNILHYMPLSFYRFSKRIFI